MRVGEAEPFAVVNVGDPAAVRDRCAEHRIVVAEDDSNRSSLFLGINHDESPVNMLIGSRKFTEGWNSWRVSSIGLMRMGKSEGTQIIQLFGRGVRLRGYKMSLRRSSAVSGAPRTPRNMKRVETLQVFGVKAAYMSEFQKWILSEVPEARDRQVWDLPVVKTLPERRLKTLQIKSEIDGVRVSGGHAFRKVGPLVRLRPPHETDMDEEWLRRHPVRLNWLPRVRGIAAADRRITALVGEEAELPRQDLSRIPSLFFDLDALLFGLEAYKAAHGLDRLHADRQSIRALLGSRSWYELLAANEDMRLDRIENRAQWQRMAQQLINMWSSRLYDFTRRRWESPYIEVIDLSEDNASFIDQYTIETTQRVESADQAAEIARLVGELATALSQNPLEEWTQWTGQWRTVPFAGHLYQPLLYVGKSHFIQINPVVFENQWEAKFVEDLAVWTRSHQNREVYLLRNQARTGLGFFQAANYFPDFLLWTHEGGTQRLAFVDPKGITRLARNDPKIQFAGHDIPVLQSVIDRQRGGLELRAFILAHTPYADLNWVGGDDERMPKHEMEAHGVLFMRDDADRYIDDMMRQIIAPGTVASA